MKHYKLIIFDVDGTLVQTKSGATFRKTASDWQWLPGRLEKLEQLKVQGIKLALATNQGGVAFGLLDYHEMRSELERLRVEMQADYLAICFTHPKATRDEYRMDSPRRKPGPGMLQDAMNALSIASEDTLMVGDREEDARAALNAGVDFAWADRFFEGG